MQRGVAALVVLTLLLPLASCRGLRNASERLLVTKTLEHDGLERSYHVHAPESRPKSGAPLVLVLHGGGGNGLRFDRGTRGQIRREADARGWIVVYPEGIEKGWNDGREKQGRRDRRRAGVDDVGFLSALIRRMQRDYAVDPRRVYATGISNGGFMSLRLATDVPEELAAIAAVTAQLGVHQQDARPGAPVGVLLMNGTEDPLVPYDGGTVKVLGNERGRILSTEASIAWWVRHNGCRAEPLREVLPDVDGDDGTRVRRTRYTGCRDGREVVLYRIEGGGHTWPRGLQYLSERWVGRVSQDIDATQHIFDFFERQR